jgi:thioredoxin 1
MMSPTIKHRGILLLASMIWTLAAQPARDAEPAQPQDSSQQIANKIVSSKKPVLVDFWAIWCAPCRMLDPTIKKLEKEYKGKVSFIKVDVDRHRQIAAYFRVQGIPAVYIIKDRTVQKALTGFQPEEAYREALEAVITPPKTPSADSLLVNNPAADTL